MAKATVSRDDFIAAWRQNGGSPQRVADSLGVNIAAVYHRRTRLAKRGIVLHTTPADGRLTKERLWSVPHPTRAQRHEIDIADGVMIVFSDVHRWPGEPTTAERALLALIRQLKPRIVVANGDVFDGAGLSRHDPNGWETLPTVAEGFPLKTWRGGPDAGKPKLSPSAKGLLDRGLMRLDTNACRGCSSRRQAWPPCAN